MVRGEGDEGDVGGGGDGGGLRGWREMVGADPQHLHHLPFILIIVSFASSSGFTGTLCAGLLSRMVLPYV